VGHSYGHGIENPWHSRTLPVKAKHKTNDRAAGQGDRGDGDGGLGRFSGWFDLPSAVPVTEPTTLLQKKVGV